MLTINVEEDMFFPRGTIYKKKLGLIILNILFYYILPLRQLNTNRNTNFLNSNLTENLKLIYRLEMYTMLIKCLFSAHIEEFKTTTFTHSEISFQINNLTFRAIRKCPSNLL